MSEVFLKGASRQDGSSRLVTQVPLRAALPPNGKFVYAIKEGRPIRDEDRLAAAEL
jgi:hypothetical protein